MDDQDDDFDFTDADALNGLPQSTLHHLELEALSSTQQRVNNMNSRNYTNVTKPFKLSAPSIPRQNSIPPQRTLSARQTSLLPQHNPNQSLPPQPSPEPIPDPPSSDYGFGDEDVVDMDEPSLLIQSASGAPPLGRDQPKSHEYDQDMQGYDHRTQYQQQHNPAPQHLQPHHQSVALEAHLEEARQRELEIESLKRALAAAEEAKHTALGETGIVRKNMERKIKEIERKFNVEKSLHDEAVAKFKADTKALQESRDKKETDLRFLEHELAQETASKKLKASAKANAQTSPRKNASSRKHDIPYRDGFDDDEIAFVSPSKPKEKAKAETPKAGEKRKRKVDPSPVIPLPLNPTPPAPSPSVATIGGAESFAVSSFSASPLPQPNPDSLRYNTIRHVLEHRPAADGERTLEFLTRNFFPSDPTTSVSSLLVGKLTHYVPTKDKPDLPMYVCNILLDLWSKCLQERCYAPVSALVDLLEFVLALGPRWTANVLIATFVPLATKTIDLIAVPLACPPPPSINKGGPAPIADTKSTSLQQDIDVDHILSAMHNMAITASLSSDANQDFWERMEFDFVLMMLNVPQPLPHIQLVLQMVTLSIQPESFGVISPQAEKQSTLEMHTIDRLTTLLFEIPKAPVDEPPYEDWELASLRIETIRTLGAISRTQHGSVALAQHRTAIGRLLRFMHIQITTLYDLPQSNTSDMQDWDDNNEKKQEIRQSRIHKLTTTIINLTIRLFYHLLHHHADLINLREKVAVIPGGHHKFLVSLTRLAFSDQLVYEAGIEEEAVDAAHEILDHVLNPEEGDAVFEAMMTPRGSNHNGGRGEVGGVVEVDETMMDDSMDVDVVG